MWKQMVSSPLKEEEQSFKQRLKKDTGLLQLGPVYESSKVVSEERLLKILPLLEKYYELWVAYPDKLVYMLLPPETRFKLFPFQVLSLRVNMRYKYVFQTATRGYSKSFIAVLSKIIKCILLPGSKETMVAEHKTQAAQIGREKIQELSTLMPLLEEEFDRRKGSGTTFSQDFVRLAFKNGSQLDIVGVGDSTRGGRRHGIIVEEVKDIPGQPLNEVVLPLLNISRRTTAGDLNPREPHQQQLYVGSAGYKGSFAYDKAIEIAVMTALTPEKAFIWGGDYKIPIYYGLLNPDFVEELRQSSTYDESSFSREFCSKWTSNIEGSLFDFDKLCGLRKLKRAEWRPENDPKVFYVAAIDVGRHQARTVVEIFKVRIKRDSYQKNIVNILLLEGRNFLHQASKIKELDATFNFESLVIDANGIGDGLIDFLMLETTDVNSGFTYPPYNIQNIKDYEEQYGRDQKVGGIPKIHVIKTNQHNAGLIHSNAYTELFSGKVKLLIDEREAKDHLLQLQKGQKMNFRERARYMEPYKWTTLLINETSNLKINRTNVNFKLELIRADWDKDTFSALEYGLWYICEKEKDHFARMRRQTKDYSKLLLIN